MNLNPFRILSHFPTNHWDYATAKGVKITRTLLSGTQTLSFPIDKFNVGLAGELVSNRIHALFADEVISSITSFEDAMHTLKTTPAPMPPFPKMWIEGLPNMKRFADLFENEFFAVGAYVEYMDLTLKENADQRLEAIDIIGSAMQGRLDTVRKEPIVFVNHKNEQTPEAPIPYHRLNLFVYAQGIRGKFGPIAVSSIYLNEAYDTLQVRDKQFGHTAYQAVTPLSVPRHYDINSPEHRRYIEDIVTLASAMVVKALGILNCSNVEFVEEGRTNNEVSAKRRHRDRLAWIKYHVLKVRVGKELKPVEPKIPSGDGFTPLTIVRGHFRDYSEGKGLFGRLSGSRYQRVWVPTFMRGSSDNGVVVKDYELKTDSK